MDGRRGRPQKLLQKLLCGEPVGILLDHRVIRPRAEGSVLLNHQTMRADGAAAL